MIDDLSAARPQSGLLVGLGRLAGAGRGRDPALHGDLPGHRCRRASARSAARATTTSPGPRNGRPSTPIPEGRPGRRRRSAPRAAASTSTTSTSSATAGRSSAVTSALLPAQPVHHEREAARKLGKRIGAKDKAYKPVWNFAPDAPLDERPYGGTITVKYPYNTISYKYDRATNTYLRSVTGRRSRPTPARGRGSRRRTSSSCGCASVRSTTGIPERRAWRRPSSAVDRPGSRPTAGRSRARGRRRRSPKPTQFYDAKGNEVTLTIGQTFVQVVTTSTTGYPVSFKAGSDTPPATPVPSASPAN